LGIRRVIWRINGVIRGGVTGGERRCGRVRGLVMINRRIRVGVGVGVRVGVLEVWVLIIRSVISLLHRLI
jgi:hypothetical protein